MKPAFIVAAALLAVLPLSVSVAQNNLPTTRVTVPKPKVHPVIAKPAAAPAQPAFPPYITNVYRPITLYPDPNYDVRAKDWNAPGAINLRYMSDAQFAAFEMAHPTAVIVNRCYIGQDPDLQIRSKMRQYYTKLSVCGG